MAEDAVPSPAPGGLAPLPAFLALDGGASKTDAVLVSRQGDVLGRSSTGPSNHQMIGLDAAIDALGEAIAGAVADAGIADPPFPLCDLGVYCLAGIDLAVDEERLAPAIALRGWTGTDLLRNDTFAVSRAGTSVPWGIGVVCGTGMNCAGVGPDGTSVRFPALAELSGDFAPGGAWLGVRALGLALRASDGRGGPTLLRTRVPGYFDLPDAEAVLNAVYTGDLGYGRLFELASVLLTAASEGDPPARQAADLLADEVVAFVVAAATRLGVTDQAVEVVLGGGIFKTDDADFHTRVADGIHAVAPRAVLRHLTAPPVLGAALLGLDVLGADDEAKERLRAALS
ncbi:MAG TPA: BadF/BadG/BcrA/BcrD ATPase family protein [Acidimicrobiales bacterium]|nr:BadF/BadG/BcrA/BcrD ATPase family protein [Acidimicrobiales bacterium]